MTDSTDCIQHTVQQPGSVGKQSECQNDLPAVLTIYKITAADLTRTLTGLQEELMQQMFTWPCLTIFETYMIHDFCNFLCWRGVRIRLRWFCCLPGIGLGVRVKCHGCKIPAYAILRWIFSCHWSQAILLIRTVIMFWQKSVAMVAEDPSISRNCIFEINSGTVFSWRIIWAQLPSL